MLTLLSCAGESKQSDNGNFESENIPTESAKEIVIFDLNSDNISNEQSDAFKVRAEQKVKDFFDYVKIISDPKVEEDFKIHALELASNLFASDTSTIKDSLLIEGTEATINEYLNNITTSKNSVIIIPKKIAFTQEFLADSTGSYSAIIQVKFIAKGKVSSKNLQIYLLETDKIIGDNTGSKEGMIISLIAAFVSKSTNLP